MDVIDTNEAARIIGTSTNNLRQMVFKKKINVVKREGRKAYFSRDEIEAFAQTRVKVIAVSQTDHPTE
jgi:uncharacterized protein (UPF0216 family)